MNTNVTSNFQIKLIAFGLFAIIPTTINLGLSFIFPKTDWNTYQKLEKEYLKKNMPNYDEYEKEIQKPYNSRAPQSKQQSNIFSSYNEYAKKWQESKEYKDLKATDKQHDQYRFIILCFLIVAILSTLVFIHIPIVHAAIMYAILFLFIFELNRFSAEIIDSSFFIPLDIVRILTSLICLLITLNIVYKDQN